MNGACPCQLAPRRAANDERSVMVPSLALRGGVGVGAIGASR
jgi:hypothetical protein